MRTPAAAPTDACRQQLQQELAASTASGHELCARAAALGGALATLQATQAVLASGKRRVLCGNSRQAVAQLVLADVVARLPGEGLQQLPLLAGLPALDAAGDEVCSVAGASQRPAVAAGAPNQHTGSRPGAPPYTAGPGAYGGASAASGGRPPLPRSSAYDDDDDDDDSIVVDSISAALSAANYTPRRSLAYGEQRRSIARGMAPAAATLQHASLRSSRGPVPAAAAGPWLVAGTPTAAAGIAQAASAPAAQAAHGSDSASDTDSLVTALSTLAEEEPVAGAGSEPALPPPASMPAPGVSALPPAVAAGLGDAPVDALLPQGTLLETLTLGQLLQLLTQAVATAGGRTGDTQ